jgi:site-specific recombinase XerD
MNGHYDNIMVGVKNPRKYKGFKKRPLSVDEINNLLRSINRGTAQGKRDYAMISLMLRSAMRTVEVSRCNFSDLEESEGQYYLWIRRKGQDEKTKISLTFKAFDAINDYLVERRGLSDTAPLFANIGPRSTNKRIQPQSLSFIIKNRMRAAGIIDSKVTAHSLRHTAATMALKQGASLHEVQLFLGHTNPATTQLYLKAIEEERRLHNTPGKLIDEVF